jgi:probable HAF family extracellular repeat protein
MPAEGGTAGTAEAVPSDGGTAGAIAIDPQDPCSAEPCENGTCTAVGDTYDCSCDDGYTGETCETNIDDCAPNPCENGGRCDDLVAGYECVCGKTFTGVNCELPRFQLLGALAGDDTSRVWDMTPDGAVLIGTSRNASKDGVHAFRWSNGVMETLPRRPGEEDSFVAAITPDGATIVGVSESATDVVGYRIDAGEVTYLPALTNGVLASVYDVSADGRVVVGYSYDDHSTAVRWIGGTPESLDVPEYLDAVASQARATNADGTIIFGIRVQGPPFVWSGGEVTNLPVPTASPNCYISGASEKGDVAIGYCSGENAHSVVRWTGSTLEDLGAPPERLLDQPWFQFDGVSRNATAAAGFAESTAGREPMLWDSIHGMRWLRIVLEDAGIDTSEWDDMDAAAISDDGRIVAGAVLGGDQKWQAFVARLP